MNNSSRNLVHLGLDHAYDSALPVLRARLQDLPLEVRIQALQCAEGIRACLMDLADSPGPSKAIQDSLIRLIFSHGDPEMVGALREFTEIVNFYLIEIRDKSRSRQERRES